MANGTGMSESNAWQKAQSFVEKRYGWKPDTSFDADWEEDGDDSRWEFIVRKDDNAYLNVYVHSKFPFRVYDDTDREMPMNGDDLAVGNSLVVDADPESEDD